MRVLVTGAGGMLGQDVVAEFHRRGAEVLPLARAELDITQSGAVRETLAGTRPDIVVNCAAYTNVDGAEAERDTAFHVNGLAVRHLALASREAGAVLVHFSTDYVFDGEKDSRYGVYDPPRPINAYGESKLWGERALAEAGGQYFLIRTSWLCGLGSRNFVEAMVALGAQWRDGSRHEPLRVVDDQRGCPTFTPDLAAAAADLIATGCYGNYHVTNTGSTTWYGFARAIFGRLGWDIPIEPIATAEFPRPARRPRNSVLDPFPLQEVIGRLPPSWEDALARYLATRGRTTPARVPLGETGEVSPAATARVAEAAGGEVQ